MSDYKLFMPPEQLAEKGVKNWSKKEAEEYKDWLISGLDERISNLLKYFDEQEEDNALDLLEKLGKKVSDKLKEAEFSEEVNGRMVLTNKGAALAADIGLLIAKYLLRDCESKIYWTIIRKPKSEMAYNLPVLEIKGFNYLDPVGGSMSEARAIINNKKSYDIWPKIYSFWKEKAR